MAEKEWNPIIGQKPRRVAFFFFVIIIFFFFIYIFPSLFLASCAFFLSQSEDPGPSTLFQFRAKRCYRESETMADIFIHESPFYKIRDSCG